MRLCLMNAQVSHISAHSSAVHNFKRAFQNVSGRIIYEHIEWQNIINTILEWQVIFKTLILNRIDLEKKTVATDISQ